MSIKSSSKYYTRVASKDSLVSTTSVSVLFVVVI